MSEGTLRRQTAFGLLWAGIESCLKALMQFAVLAVMARLLTPADYGLMGTAAVVVGISTIFAQIGVGPAIVQRQEIRPSHLNAAFHTSLAFGGVVMVIVLASTPSIAAFFRAPALSGILEILAVIFPISAIGVVPESLLTRDLRFKALARVELISYLLGYGGIGIGCAIAHLGVWSLVWAQLTQSVLRNALLFIYHPWRPHWSFEWAALRDLLPFSGGTTLARLANYIASSGDTIVVGRVLGSIPLGLYGRAYQIMVAPVVLLGNVLEKVLFPSLAKVQDNADRLREVFLVGLRGIALVMVPCSVILGVLAPDIVHLLLGSKWMSIVLPLRLFAGAVFFRTAMKLCNSLIRAKGAVFGMAACQIIYAVTTILFAWFGTQWEIEGVCAGVLLSIIICFGLSFVFCLRLVGGTASEALRCQLPGLTLGILELAAGVGTSIGLRQVTHSTLLTGTGTGLVMALVTAIALFAAPNFFLQRSTSELRLMAKTCARRFSALRVRGAPVSATELSRSTV